jgi:hypothetical protein
VVPHWEQPSHERGIHIGRIARTVFSGYRLRERNRIGVSIEKV